MFIKYIGGRSRMDISFNRVPYCFTPENNRMLDIKDSKIINYIFSLPNRTEFEVVDYPKEVVPKPFVKSETIKLESSKQSMKVKSKKRGS